MSGAVVRFREAARVEGLTIEVHTFPEGTKTAEDAARAIGSDVAQIVKSLVFTAEDGSPVLALTSGRHRVDTDALEPGARLAHRGALARNLDQRDDLDPLRCEARAAADDDAAHARSAGGLEHAADDLPAERGGIERALARDHQVAGPQRLVDADDLRHRLDPGPEPGAHEREQPVAEPAGGAGAGLPRVIDAEVVRHGRRELLEGAVERPHGVVVCGRASLAPEGVEVVSLVEVAGQGAAMRETRTWLERIGERLASGVPG